MNSCGKSGQAAASPFLIVVKKSVLVKIITAASNCRF
jgi:hypothetical protein